MVAYSFKPMFVEHIQSGRKRQTIRKERYGRARHATPGGPVTLLTGPRFKPLLLGRTVCESIWLVQLSFAPVEQVTMQNPVTGQRGSIHTIEGLNQFAREDGFDDFSDMKNFWQLIHSTTKFEGTMIKWRFPFND